MFCSDIVVAVGRRQSRINDDDTYPPSGAYDTYPPSPEHDGDSSGRRFSRG